ncbi:MAG: ATP-binding protein [Gemmatimonadaceae bacterium]|nr:ATP-binding protein [Gemmatimonadaceae bacterium]
MAPRTAKRVLLHPVGPAQLTYVTPAEELRVITAEQSPAQYALCAYLALQPTGAAQRSALREMLYRGAPSGFRKAIQRFRAAGWLTTDDETDAVHLIGGPAVLPGRDAYPTTEWMQLAPGRVLDLGGLHERFTPEWLDWMDAQREEWTPAILAQLEQLGDIAWSTMDLTGGRALAAHIEAIAPDAPVLRRWRVHRQPSASRGASARDRPFAARWPELARPQLEARLAAHLRTPADPSVLLLQGEAGIGKTVLLDRLLTAASAWGSVAPRLLRVRGQWMPPSDGLPSWRPSSGLHDWLRRLLDMRGAIGGNGYILLHECVQGGRDALSALSPEDVTAAALDVLAAVREADRRPFWWVVDDLHFLDGPLLRILIASLQERRGCPWAVLAASRDAPPPLWRDMAQRGEGQWSWVTVPPCVPEHVGVVAAALELPHEIVANVFDLARGHAFRWYEMMRRLVAGGDVGADVSLEQLLLEEVRRWPDSTQRVAAVLAIAGDRAYPDIVAEMAQMPADAAEHEVDQLIAHDVAERQSTTDGRRWALTADRWRDAVLQSIEGSAATALHARMAALCATHPVLRTRVDVRIARLAHLCGAHQLTTALEEAPTLLPSCAALGSLEEGIQAWKVVLEIAHDAYGSLPAAMRDHYAGTCLLHEIEDQVPRFVTSTSRTLTEHVLQVLGEPRDAPTLLGMISRLRAELPEPLHLLAANRVTRAAFDVVPWDDILPYHGEVRALLADHCDRRARGATTPGDEVHAARLMVTDAKLANAALPREVFAIIAAPERSERGAQPRALTRLRYFVETSLAASGHYGAYWELRGTFEHPESGAARPWRQDLRAINDVAVLLAMGEMDQAAMRFAVLPPPRESRPRRSDGVTEMTLALQQPTRTTMQHVLTRYRDAIEALETAVRGRAPHAVPRAVRINYATLQTMLVARSGGDVGALRDLWVDLPYRYLDAHHIAGQVAHGRWLCALAARGEHATVAEAVQKHREHGHTHALTTGWSISYRALAAFYGHREVRALLDEVTWRPQASWDEAWQHALATVPVLPTDQLARAQAGGPPLPL